MVEFEWDEQKRLSNIEKHGIDFRWACSIFDGRPRVDVDSSRPEESRTLSVTLLDDICVAAVWTVRDGKIRFISVRYARRSERMQYHRLTGNMPRDET